MKCQIAWYQKSPTACGCWAASTDGGKNWKKLKADDAEQSYEAIDEANETFGHADWDVLENNITTLFVVP